MDQVHVVRHKVLVEGRSQRAVARELRLARVTVRKYLLVAGNIQKAARCLPCRLMKPERRSLSDEMRLIVNDSGSLE